MGPVICAFGRSENHALVGFHARALGIEYIAFDQSDAKSMIDDPGMLTKAIEARLPLRDLGRPPILTTIDSSIRPERVRSMIASSQRTFQLPISLHGNLSLLTTFPSQNSDTSVESLAHRVAVTAVRSPHGQTSIWPIRNIASEGLLRPIEKTSPNDPEGSIDNLDSLLSQVQQIVMDSKLVGALTFIADGEGEILLREWGITSMTMWSENVCHTSVAEQLVRALVDLPLGDTRIIDDDEYYLEEEVALEEVGLDISERLGRARPDLETLLIDPTRPFLHLFARNPKLKVTYLSKDHQRVKISVYAPNEITARLEVEHAKAFMAGLD